MRQIHRSMVAAWIAVLLFTAMTHAAEPIEIGSRRELFVDHHLVTVHGLLNW